MEECIFCKISKGKVPVEKVYENKNFFSIPDLNPKVEGHSLIISKKHFENVLGMPSTLGFELMDCIKNTAFRLTEKYNSEGFNLINNNFEAAGQVVKHVHFHLLPRKKTDGFRIGL